VRSSVLAKLHRSFLYTIFLSVSQKLLWILDRLPLYVCYESLQNETMKCFHLGWNIWHGLHRKRMFKILPRYETCKNSNLWPLKL
jgi:hypothetical protein